MKREGVDSSPGRSDRPGEAGESADPLGDYKAKRDFARTAEPAGGAPSEVAFTDPASTGGPNVHTSIFCVQKHAASSLHYDLRLELGGVLKSWAVPKGPSLDPRDKRLAVRTEDHPLEYAGFEGTIPEGEYGGGTVMLWDMGWWEPDTAWSKEFAREKEHGEIPDAAGKLAGGELKFVLHGQKLKGSFVLVQMKGRGPKNWLLIKHKDDEARPGFDLVKAEPDSALSGRTMEEIALAEDVTSTDDT